MEDLQPNVDGRHSKIEMEKLIESGKMTVGSIRITQLTIDTINHFGDEVTFNCSTASGKMVEVVNCESVVSDSQPVSWLYRDKDTLGEFEFEPVG